MTTRRNVLKGAIALTLPATVALPALTGSPDAEILALCRLYHDGEDRLCTLGRDITDEDDAPVLAAVRAVEHSKPQTLQGATEKLRALTRFYEGSVKPRTMLSDILADLERLAGRRA